MLDDRNKELKANISNRLTKALTMAAIVAQESAIIKVPVDTGLLKNSLTYKVEDNSAYIGTNVFYAPYVEFGTKYQRAQPFLAPAISENKDKIIQIIKRELKDDNR